jgi:nicotinamide-nucleotide amidase
VRVSARAGIVVTGNEVLSGRVADRNGPWLAERLLDVGADLAFTVLVADRPDDLRAALAFLAERGTDLVVTSGGLGPTADDLTAEVVAEAQGRRLELDGALEQRIWAIVQRLRGDTPGLDREAMRVGARKQAWVPRGATVLEPVGTAPGLVVPPADDREGPTVLVLPGPPTELQPMWETAMATAAVRAALARATRYELRTLRLYGIPESEIAETLRAAGRRGIELDRLEVTTCLRRGELEVVSRYEPEHAEVEAALEELVRERHPDALFSADGTSIDEQVARLLLDQGARIAVAESCTGGLLAARLTERAGSSAYVLGGVVAYANEAKVALAGVDPALIAEHGAVSAQVAEALARGVVERFGADVGVGVTGVAGPGGGSPDKPVGLVCFGAAHRDGRLLTRAVRLPGDRAGVRDRSTTAALHLVRRLLTTRARPTGG